MKIISIAKRATAIPVGYLFAMVCLLAPLAIAAQNSSPPDSHFTISVSVNEVVLHATARNRKGAPVDGLAKENFQVFEDHVQQPIKHFSHNDIPATVGLVIDNSGSMRPKRTEVVAAALAFAGFSNPQDQMFLVNFNEHVSFGLPKDTLFTDRPEQLKSAMDTMITDGKTALYDAVALALERLKLGNRDKKVLIVVSDGADNASVHTKAQILQMVAQSNAIIYGVGIYEADDPDRNPHVVSELTKSSGGEAFFPESLSEVQPICERIAREIRNQYTLTYVPTNQKQDGTNRTIEVRAVSPQGKSVVVTTRTGYTSLLAPALAATGKPLSRAAKPEAKN